MKVKALDKSNCAVARPGGKEAGVKLMSPRTGTGYEAGDADELVPHNEVQGSASQVSLGLCGESSRPYRGDLPGEPSIAQAIKRHSHGKP